MALVNGKTVEQELVDGYIAQLGDNLCCTNNCLKL